MLARLSVAAFAVLALAACGDDETVTPNEDGRTIFGLTTQNQLVRFQSTAPDEIDRTVAITGLAAGETALGLDFRTAASGSGLYILTSASKVYTVDTLSGAATAVATASFAPTLDIGPIGLDFNPVPDRLRVHNSTRQNLRLNQLNGTVAGVDGTLTYASGDVNAGSVPRLVGTAYTNAIANTTATTTVLFAIDATSNTVVRLANPNDGQLTTVGSLGLDASDDVGFDIAGSTGEALAAIRTASGSTSGLYSISVSGSAQLIGNIGTSNPLVGITIVP